jgi:hypothetical protein
VTVQGDDWFGCGSHPSTVPVGETSVSVFVTIIAVFTARAERPLSGTPSPRKNDPKALDHFEPESPVVAGQPQQQKSETASGGTVSGTASIEKLWNELDPKTQEWLRANPGSVVLPRSVTAVIRKAMGDPDNMDGTDRNDQLSLSPEDHAFIRSMANSAPVGHPVSLNRSTT